MAVSAAQARTKERLTGMDPRSDMVLLAAIAREDRAAFEIYFQRHQRSVYNLALHITGRTEMAEEAVQEALLRVWLSARNVRSDGNPQGWLKRIVARESITLMRKKQKDTAKMERHRQLDSAPVLDAPDPVEQGELQRALGRKLEELHEPDRQLIALYYGAGMSQREIGEVLDIPQRTVSHRVTEAVGRLRATLASAGLAAAAPLLSDDGLAQVITSARPVPGSLDAKVAAHLSLHAAGGAKALSHASRRAAAKSSGGLLMLGAALAAGAIAMVAVLNREDAPAPAAAQQEPAPIPEDSAHAKTDEPLSMKWSFADGPSEDFRILQGSWFWERRQDGRGGMTAPYTDTKAPALALPPKTPHGKPFILTAIGQLTTRYDSKGKPMGRGGIEVFWLTQKEVVAHARWLKTLETRTNATIATSIYCLGSHIIHTVHNTPTMVYEYDAPYPGETICINLENVAIFEMSIREIREAEMPDNLRDIEALKKALGKPLAKPAVPVPPSIWQNVARGEKRSP
ncbi:MAG: sigma-70 family RNA polymerase sigma factor [Planctomycetes bacterium]|nr:sigma-70 family RNA polymerase sigma factor [Planctomycetota bacterium]